jgi:DNA mismatch repair protein MutS2
VIRNAESVLFKKKQVQQNQAAAKKADKSYEVTGGEAQPGDLVRHRTNHQVGTLSELKGKHAVVLIGKMPFNVALEDWVRVRKKDNGKNRKPV